MSRSRSTAMPENSETTQSWLEVQARYLRRYRKQRTVFNVLDRALSVVFPGNPSSAGTPPAPRKLLVCNYGHLGDLLITTSLLPALKQAFPDVEIGLLTGTWNKTVVEGNPLISRVHFLDHWFQVRSAASFGTKLKDYWRGLPALVRELKAIGYDTAVDLRPWFPNSIPVLWLARIPVRIGFDRVGFEPLLSHSVAFEYDRRHERDHQATPLRKLPLVGALLDELPLRWLTPTESGRSIVQARASMQAPPRYVILHTGASTPVRNWTEEGWKELAKKVLATGARPVFTGLGAAQEEVIARITRDIPEAIDLCSKLSWRELVAVIADAETVYCVETSVGHLGGALGVPVVAIYGGMQDPQQWRPAGRRVALVTHELSCSPCFQRTGCEHLSCLRNIPVTDVWRAGSQLTAPP